MTTPSATSTEAVRVTPAAGGSRKWAPGNWRPLTLLLPAILIITLFFIVPLVEIFVRSVSDPVLGFQNYAWVVTNENVLRVLVRTFVTSLAVTVITLLLAYPYAYLMTIVGDSARSVLTLFIMLVCTVIFMPLILAYTAWVYRVLWGKVTEADVTENSHSVY